MTASANLPLPLTANERPSSDELHLRLGDVDNTLADEPAVPLSSELPLQLTANGRPLSSELPLILGTGNNSSDGDGDEDGSGDEPPPPRPKFPSVVGCYQAVIQKARQCTRQESWLTSSHRVAGEYHTKFSPSLTIAKRHAISTYGFVPINHCYHNQYSESWQLTACKQLLTSSFIAVKQAFDSDVSPTIGYTVCNKSAVQTAIQKISCQTADTQAVTLLQTSNTADTNAVNIARSHRSTIQKAIAVPCRYYPIPASPPTKPTQGLCRIRPPASELPLMLRTHDTGYPSSSLPLPMSCWHDVPTLPIPIKDTYMIHTEFIANIGGIAVEPLSFSIQTDMKSFCWQGEVSLSASDYEKVKHKLTVEVGDEPMVTVFISYDGVYKQFAFIAEDVSRSRRFARHTHKIGGRSMTARLGSDYAVANDKLFTLDNYANQIVGQQLQNTSIEIEEFGVDDWFIPANSYSVSNKTPIAVIADIAEAAGGYVESHKFDSKLSIKKRWKVNAWELATATPDVIIPYSVILQSDDKPVQNTRYNTVRVGSDILAHHIYRKGQGRDLDAGAINHNLFTDQNVTIHKGSAVLSDSGKHNFYQLNMPWSNEIPLAEMGQIWQVDDMDGSWRGVVTGVKVTAELINEAMVVYQTVTVDRYLDK